MTDSMLIEMVRQFPENGMKRLLSNPQNVHDLLNLTNCDLVELIDFEYLKPLPTNLVKRDYRHVECDVVLSAPLRRKARTRRARSLLIYILIEHQSNPDWLMPLRLLDYLVQLYWSQLRGAGKSGHSFRRQELHPVLPIVFYTGTQRWDSPGSLGELLGMGERFAQVTPSFTPLFVNLGSLPAKKLEAEGGFFGWVMRLVQERHDRTDEFQRLLEQVIGHLESMPQQDRMRWLEMLSYIHALVYHIREPSERPRMRQIIETSVKTDRHRQDVSQMAQTIAQALREEGRQEGALELRRETLLRLLKNKFQAVPVKTRKIIQATADGSQLDHWIDRVMIVKSLAEIGIEKRV